jgi:hypothetical protein
MKKFLIGLFLLTCISPLFAEEIQTTFVTPDTPAIRTTFNIPENVDGVIKYYPIRHDIINGKAKTSSGATMDIEVHINVGTLSDTPLTPQQIYALLLDTNMQEIFAQFYQTACGMNIKE